MAKRRIVIVGSGFAGVWAAIGSAALLQRRRASAEVEVTLVSPDGALVIRPRLYEADLSGVRIPLHRLLSPVGVIERRATVQSIDLERRALALTGEASGELGYEQLVLCAGSRVSMPGGADGVLCADSYEQARAMHEAVAALADRPGARFSAAVVGAGFTGIEVAAELAETLRGVARSAGAEPAQAAVALIDRAPTVGPEFGASARAVIERALGSLGVELRSGVAASQVDAGGVTLAGGERIETDLTVWSAGPRASALNEQLGLPLDAQGRLAVDAQMASGLDGVWAAGDCASATVDGRHRALMSCQHAMPQGRQAGENAAAALLGDKLGRYRQPLYLTCLDLGSAGALLTCGFERERILATGEQGKRFKRFINRSLIYPPASERAADLLSLGGARPAGSVVARIQQRALRSNALRSALVSRGDDRATKFALLEE
jgi:NADH dehydrogenase